MRKTYAYNSIIFGVLLGLLVEVKANSLFLGIITFIVVSVAGFFIIRAFEDLLFKGVDKGIDAATKAVTEAINKKKVK